MQGNSKRMNEAETRMKRKRKYRSFSIQDLLRDILCVGEREKEGKRDRERFQQKSKTIFCIFGTILKNK